MKRAFKGFAIAAVAAALLAGAALGFLVTRERSPSRPESPGYLAAHAIRHRRWRWGDANRLAVRHPLGRIPGLSWLFDSLLFPQSGATGVVYVASGAFGQSMRFIVDWGVPEEATLVIPFGVSGHVGSPHRLDQLPFWRDGDASGSATRLSRPARKMAGFAP